MQGDDAAVADEVVGTGLFDPTLATGTNLGGGGIEFEGGVDGAGEGAVGFVVEAGGEGFEDGGEEVVVLGVGVGDGEAGFEGGEGDEHSLGV